MWVRSLPGRRLSVRRLGGVSRVVLGLVVLAVLPLAASACSGGSPAAGSNPTAGASSSATPPPLLTLRRVGPADALLRGHGAASFSFKPLADQAAYSWTWQAVAGDGAVAAQGAGQAPAGGVATVTWNGRAPGGEQADPGLYRVAVAVQDASGAQGRMHVLGLVRWQPPVKAQVFRNLAKAGNEVALTFDGGSGHAWRHIMLQLESVNAKGTFFCTGVSVDHYPEDAKLAVRLGETLGSHSYDHPLFTSISNAKMVYQLTTADGIWWRAAHAMAAPYFRPPYGGYDQRVLKVAGRLGYSRVILWDVDTGDWTGETPAVVAQHAIHDAKPGSIILMHTDWNAEKAVPAIVRGLRARGLEPVTLDQLFRDAGYK